MANLKVLVLEIIRCWSNKMKDIFKTILFLISCLFFTSCDPLEMAVVKNNTKSNITIKLYCKDSIERELLKSLVDFKVNKIENTLFGELAPDEELLIATGEKIAAHLKKKDFYFDKIDIISSTDTLCYNKSAFVNLLEDNFFWKKTFEIK